MVTRAGIAALVALALIAGCKRKRSPREKPPAVAKAPKPACTPAYATHRCAEGDAFACRWRDAMEVTPLDDDALRALIPSIGEKLLVDGDPPVPQAPTYSFESSAPYVVSLPVDWAADPFGDRSWRSNFQNLNWLYSFYGKGDTDLDTAAYLVVDWTDQALAPDADLEWTWRDAALAKRLERVTGFLARYVADRSTLSRRVLRASVRVIASHLGAMSMDACYTGETNHGMMQDLALIKSARTLPGVPEADAIWEHARDRLVEHVEASVTDEGIQIENSPEYQVLYLRLLVEAIDVFRQLGEPPAPALIAARDGMQSSLVYLLQPNLTLPQFGDTTNNGPQRIRETLDAARAQGSTSPALDQLDWLLTGGTAGRSPTELQRVFGASGLASFRERWAGADAITAHFRCGRLSETHVHDDDTSFELYGHGTELVVDTGKFSYAYGEALVEHQYDVRAHNVLVVDDAAIDDAPSARIAASGDGWVRGEHRGYASRGVSSVTRTFAYARPDTFAIVDRAEAAAPHGYVQHFHLHPSLSDVEVIDERTVIASTPGGGPAITLTAGETPVRIEVVRGRNDAAGVQGWYFAGYKDATPTADVAIDYGLRDGPSVAFPVVITVAAPATDPRPATAVRLTGDGIEWRRDGKPFSVELPAN